MASNDLFITPRDIMRIHRPHLLEINSNMDGRTEAQRETRDLLYGEDSDFEPEEIGMRYEPDTQRLYIDAKWLRRITIEETLTGNEYLNELKRCTQYMGVLTMRLLKGTGCNTAASSCLLFDLNRACAPSVKTRNRTENARELGRAHLADPNFINMTNPLLDRLRVMEREVKDEIRAGTIDLDAAKYILENARKERKLIERIKYGKTTDVRTVRVSKQIPKRNRAKLNIMALAKELASTDNLMVRQIVQDIHAPEGHREVIVDAVGEVLGYLKQDRKERKLYLVVSHLKKHIPNYRRDYRYTHSQTTYLTELHDDPTLTHHYAADRLRVPHKLNKYCAVFDLKRSYEGDEE